MRKLVAEENWTDLIDTPLPDAPIDEISRQVALDENSRFRASVRVATGRFWTDEEYRRFRERVLATPMP